MHRTWTALLAMLSTSACATVLYDRETRTVVASERVKDTAMTTKVVDSARLLAHDLNIEHTILRGRLASARTCRDGQIDSVVEIKHREVVWVDDEGEEVSMGALGATELGIGVLMPLIVPVAVVLDADDDGPTSDKLVVAFYLGIGLGVALVVSGLVDAFAALGAGVEERWESSPIERRSFSPKTYSCRQTVPSAKTATLYVATATVGFALGSDGAFELDLAPIAEAVLDRRDARWGIEVEPEGTALIDVGELARQRLFRSLELLQLEP